MKIKLKPNVKLSKKGKAVKAKKKRVAKPRKNCKGNYIA